MQFPNFWPVNHEKQQQEMYCQQIIPSPTSIFSTSGLVPFLHQPPAFLAFSLCTVWTGACPLILIVLDKCIFWMKSNDQVVFKIIFHSILFPLLWTQTSTIPSTSTLLDSKIKCISQHSNKERECQYMSNGLDLITRRYRHNGSC